MPVPENVIYTCHLIRGRAHEDSDSFLSSDEVRFLDAFSDAGEHVVYVDITFTISSGM